MSRHHADPGGLGEKLGADQLFSEVRCALEAPPGRYYAAGSFLLETLTGAEPGGILVLCVPDIARADGRIALATGMSPVAVARAPGLVHLTRHGERGVTLVPAGSTTIEEALGRASFTVLATAVDLAEPGELIDPLGGIGHLEQGILSAASPIEDDPERLLLAARLRARFDLEPDEDTMLSLRRSAPLARRVQPRRAWAGLAGVFTAGGLSGSAAFLKETGVLEQLFPALADIYDVPQNYYHHLGVWGHTLETLDHLQEMLRNPRDRFKAYGDRLAAYLTRRVEGGVRRRTLLVLAALVHDVGKASSMSLEPSGRIRFQGHQLDGARLAVPIASRLGLGVKATRGLVAIVRDHMRLGFLMKEGETTASRLRAAVELGPHCPEVVLLSLADRMATRGEATTDEALERFKRVASRLLADWFWLRDVPPLIDGSDIIVHAGIEQGPGVGEALLRARVAQRECTVASRSQALEFLAPDFKGKMNVRSNEGEAR